MPEMGIVAGYRAAYDAALRQKQFRNEVNWQAYQQREAQAQAARDQQRWEQEFALKQARLELDMQPPRMSPYEEEMLSLSRDMFGYEQKQDTLDRRYRDTQAKQLAIQNDPARRVQAIRQATDLYYQELLRVGATSEEAKKLAIGYFANEGPIGQQGTTKALGIGEDPYAIDTQNAIRISSAILSDMDPNLDSENPAYQMALETMTNELDRIKERRRTSVPQSGTGGIGSADSENVVPSPSLPVAPQGAAGPQSLAIPSPASLQSVGDDDASVYMLFRQANPNASPDQIRAAAMNYILQLRKNNARPAVPQMMDTLNRFQPR